MPGLADVPLLATLPPARLTRLAEVAPARTVEAGTVLVVRGAPAAHLVVVETGGVTATRDTASGRRLRLGEYPAPCAVDDVPAARRHVLVHLARRLRGQQDDLVLASVADASPARPRGWCAPPPGVSCCAERRRASPRRSA